MRTWIGFCVYLREVLTSSLSHKYIRCEFGALNRHKIRDLGGIYHSKRYNKTNPQWNHVISLTKLLFLTSVPLAIITKNWKCDWWLLDNGAFNSWIYVMLYTVVLMLISLFFDTSTILLLNKSGTSPYIYRLWCVTCVSVSARCPQYTTLKIISNPTK